MKKVTVNQIPGREKCPALCGVRPAKDVKILIERAKADGFGVSWARIYNKCARQVLMEKYGSKNVLNAQDRMTRSGAVI